MSDSTFDIEHIVREVIRRLTSGNNGYSAGDGADDERCANAGTMRLAHRVVSLAQLEGRLDQVSRLVVPPRAIVTPAVQDELRRNGITLQRECERTRAADKKNGTWRILVGSHETECDIRRPLASQPSGEYDFEIVAAGKLEVLLPRIAEQLPGRFRIGLIVSRVPHIVACQANRNSAFRAAVAGDAREAAEARRTLDANLFVVRDTDVNRLQQIVSSAVRTKVEG